MKCSFCESCHSVVVDSRESKGGSSIRRRRECSECGSRFTTYEQRGFKHHSAQLQAPLSGGWLDDAQDWVFSDTDDRFLYLMHGVGSRSYKIGLSANPNSRMATIQTGCPFPLEIVMCLRCDLTDHDVHRAMRGLNNNTSGEWYRFTDRCEAVATMLAAVNAAMSSKDVYQEQLRRQLEQQLFEPAE